MAELVVKAGMRQTYVGTSAETKPTEGVTAGTFFEEVDTGTLLVYTGNDWYPVQGQGGLAAAIDQLNTTCVLMLTELTKIRVASNVLAEIEEEE